jgi:hypothetical protein
VIIPLLVVTPVPAIAQRLTAMRAGVARMQQPSSDAQYRAPLLTAVSTDEGPPRWPFVLAGALIGGTAAGVWYAHEFSKSDDPIIDLSAPVIGIGIGLGALGGFIVAEVVRGTHS